MGLDAAGVDAAGPTVAEAGEAAVVAELAGGPGDDAVDPVGNGDDAAVLGPAAATVVSTDMLCEGTHFRSDRSSWRDVGARAIAQNAADVAAMGARCTRVVVAVGLPSRTPMGRVAELADGLHSAAARIGARIVGGDVTTAPVLVVSVTALGTLPAGRPPVTMSGARPGDVVALAGHTGPSAAGLQLLDAGHAGGELQDLHRVPCPPLEAGVRARDAGATAMTDVSDGLLRDLRGLVRASGVAADLRSALLPVDPRLPAAAELLGAGPDAVAAWVLEGGEDHALVATFPPETPLPRGFVEVGVVTSGPGTEVTVDGARREPGGWDSSSSAGR